MSKYTTALRAWLEESRLRRRIAVCILVPIGILFTFAEMTVRSWIEWARNWGELLRDVREFWK